jgi:hypothetical protein
MPLSSAIAARTDSVKAMAIGHPIKIVMQGKISSE